MSWIRRSFLQAGSLGAVLLMHSANISLFQKHLPREPVGRKRTLGAQVADDMNKGRISR